VFDKGLMGMTLEDDRGEQRRIDRAATGRAVLKHRHVVGLEQRAGLIDDYQHITDISEITL
jgi:hypothetical protein